MWTVEREGKIICTFDSESAWLTWMSYHAIQSGNAAQLPYDIGIDPAGKRWYQCGYVMLPKDTDGNA